jgi:hypothetical protein
MSMALKASKSNAGATYGGAFISRSQFQGDPGLFGFLGKAVGGIAKLAGKVLPGPVGIAAGAVGGLLAGSKAQQSPGIVQTTGGVLTRSTANGGWSGGFTLPLPGPTGVKVNPLAIVPGGQPFTQSVADRQITGGCPSGYHPNKSDYFLSNGTFVAKGSRCVKNRRRNALNPRAASRAISRIESAKKASTALDRVTVRCRRCGKARCSCG